MVWPHVGMSLPGVPGSSGHPARCRAGIPQERRPPGRSLRHTPPGTIATPSAVRQRRQRTARGLSTTWSPQDKHAPARRHQGLRAGVSRCDPVRTNSASVTASRGVSNTSAHRRDAIRSPTLRAGRSPRPLEIADVRRHRAGTSSDSLASATGAQPATRSESAVAWLPGMAPI